MGNKKVLNILSIDWDYFMTCDSSYRLINFPDGNQFLPEQIQNIIWAGYYLNNPLLNIGIKSDIKILNKTLFKILNKNKSIIKYSTDHEMILEYLDYNNKYNIWNIDHHHDFHPYSQKIGINCGNWLTFLNHMNYLNKTYWIGSEEYPDEKIRFIHEEDYLIGLKGIKDILDIKFDLVFICLSPAWSSPHLDIKFKKIFSPYINTKQIKNRYSDSFKIYVEDIKLQNKILKEKHLKRKGKNK